MTPYTLGLFANMYPAYDGDWRGSFIRQMVKDLELREIMVKKAVKTSASVTGYIPFFSESLRLARDKDLDLMQAEYIPHSSLVPAFFKRKNIPLVLKFHGDDARIYPYKNRFNLALTRLMLKKAAHVISASEEIRQQLIGIGAHPEKITAIHTGVDTVFFSPENKKECGKALGLPPEETLFIFVGRLHPLKGINELLEVARVCPDIRFVFIGPGSIPVHPGNCSFIGAKLPGELKVWLNAADCMVLPTHTDAVPAVVMEAFACGIPAVTTDVGGCPEIVKNGKNGILVPLNDVERLRNAILWMAGHPDERIRMGELARITAVKNFDHNVLIGRLIKVHQNLIFKDTR